MFARSVVRAVSKAGAPSFTKVSRATFSAAATLRNETIAAKKVQTSVYDHGSVKRSTITVGDEIPAEEIAERVVPLTKAVFDKMTPSMQKMTVMGKVVVVTGYVPQFIPRSI